MKSVALVLIALAAWCIAWDISNIRNSLDRLVQIQEKAAKP